MTKLFKTFTPAKQVNIHTDKVINPSDGLEKGETVYTVDYTLDGENWINGGLYTCIDMAEEYKGILLSTGAASNREDHVFKPANNKYFEVTAFIDGEKEVLFGSFDKSDCTYEIEAEKQSWKAEGYKKIKIESRMVSESPDPEVYANDDDYSKVVLKALQNPNVTISVGDTSEEYHDLEDSRDIRAIIDACEATDSPCIDFYIDGEFAGQMVVLVGYGDESIQDHHVNDFMNEITSVLEESIQDHHVNDFTENQFIQSFADYIEERTELNNSLVEQLFNKADYFHLVASFNSKDRVFVAQLQSGFLIKITQGFARVQLTVEG